MFQNLKVIELASVLAGPSVGQFFAELGAEVIKVEHPATGGDVTRSWLLKGEKPKGTVSSYFSAVNWGKKSVVLNLALTKDREQLNSLVTDADLVVASYKAGDAEKLGADYDTLKQLNPRLIYGHVTGYGPDNPKVGYDAVIQAESGFMSINGEKGAGPLKMPVALVDVLAAHHLKEGLLLAIIQRMQTGEGSYVPVSLLDAAVSSLVNQGTNWLQGGAVPVRKGNAHPNIAPYGDLFTTADGRQLMLAVGNDKQFGKLCDLLRMKVGSDFSTNALRVENREELRSMIAEKVSLIEAELLLSQLLEHQVPAGIVHSIDEVFANASASQLLTAEGFTGIRSFVALPSGMPRLNLSPPPQLGEHMAEVFDEGQ